MNKAEILENGNVKITIPIAFRSRAGWMQFVMQKLNRNFNEPNIINCTEKLIPLLPALQDDRKKRFGMK